ncbi:tetratricopeptide repeat protein [bacterium]|nr:tetratricopeptide repeat protein [bacterium]
MSSFITRIQSFCFLAALAVSSQTSFSQEAIIDSSFNMLTLPELQNYRIYYVDELEALQQEKTDLIKRGIEDGERLLRLNPDPQMIDEIYIRLADLYYYQDKDRFFDSMDAYDIELENGNTSAPEPHFDCNRSLSVYQKIIDEFPESDLVDDATYNKAFLYEELGQHQRANLIYGYLIEAYPQSPFIPEAHMRLGEFYFNPPRNQLDKAIEQYKKILPFTSNPRYSEALYKLGWSYYRLSQYPAAISYFTTLIEDIDVTSRYDNDLALQRVNLRDEAIEYIAISFHDFGGESKALEYLNRIDAPLWGADVLLVLGDVYKEQKEEYNKAIRAYETFLEYAPLSISAAKVQKFIVDCHMALDQDVKAIEARHSLFNHYRKDGDWWLAVDNDKAHIKAYELSERAMRDNIHALIRRARDADNTALYERAVDWAEEYLKAFPENQYAYMIRWNRALILDTELGRFRDALEEYLTISLVYNTADFGRFAREKGLATVQDAAENAIVAADSLYQSERKNGSVASVGNEVDKVEMPLSTAENYLVLAYDNYIKLYPFDEKTPTILANAGALYYTHNSFDKALQYFKTLVKYFPESNQIHQVQYSILESYFGRQDYASAELLARRIADSNVDDEIKSKARQRWAEAIFFKAQILAEKGEALKAAREFYRVALEVPDVKFADRALFNAGQQFEKANELANAAQAYEYLRLTYASSSLVSDAVNNLAYDYGKLGNSAKAAQRYEMSAAMAEDSLVARDALYNAYVYAGKAGNSVQAAEIARKYAEKYPQSKDSPGLLFHAAILKIGGSNPADGIALLQQFPRCYPDSSLAVEALWRIGKYNEDAGAVVAAGRFYDQAAVHHYNLVERQLTGDEYHAADALFRASSFRQQEYMDITFRQPESVLEQDVRKALALKKILLDDYSKIAAFGTSHFPETAYRLGEVVERFGRAWESQALPLLSAAERAVKRKSIGDRAAEFYGEATLVYRGAITALRKIETELASSDTATTADSLRSLATLWRGRSEAKVSEMLFCQAEVQTDPIQGIIDAPLPADLNVISRLEYRNQLLFRAVKPQIDAAVLAHQNNISTADTLGLNNVWSDSSGTQIAKLAGILSRGYFALSNDVLSAFNEHARKYSQTTLEEAGYADESIMTSMISLNELFKTYSKASLLFGQQGLELIDRSKINGQANIIVCSMLARETNALADRLDEAVKVSSMRQTVADSLFKIEYSPYYEEVLTVVEDNAYYLKQNINVLLETAFNVLNQSQKARADAAWMGIRLLKHDKTALERIDIPIDSMSVATDTTWQLRIDKINNWTTDISAAGWANPGIGMGNHIIWYRQSLDAASSVPKRLYIRQQFDVPGYVLSAALNIKTGIAEHCYINGVSISVNNADSTSTVKLKLKTGINMLAFEGAVEDMKNFSAEITIKSIPLVSASRGGKTIE